MLLITFLWTLHAYESQKFYRFNQYSHNNHHIWHRHVVFALSLLKCKFYVLNKKFKCKLFLFLLLIFLFWTLLLFTIILIWLKIFSFLFKKIWKCVFRKNLNVCDVKTLNLSSLKHRAQNLIESTLPHLLISFCILLAYYVLYSNVKCSKHCLFISLLVRKSLNCFLILFYYTFV